MQKVLSTKAELIEKFLVAAAARGIRGKTKPLYAQVIEYVEPNATSNWGLKTFEVEMHQSHEVTSLIQELQAKFTCCGIEPAQFI